MSKALDERQIDRVIPMRYYDRIADFLGVEVYQLFQPGVSATAERRSGVDRRVKTERRARAKPDAPVPHQAALLELFGLLSEPEQAKWIRTLGEQLTERRPPPSPDTAPAAQGSRRGKQKASGDGARTRRSSERDAADERAWTPPRGSY